jgi:hypothetical protein
MTPFLARLRRSPLRAPLLASVTAACALALAEAAQEEAAPLPALWRLAEKAAEETGVGADFRTVAEHFQQMRAKPGMPAHRLERVMEALSQPWGVPGLGADLRDALAGTLGGKGGARYGETAKTAAAWLGLATLAAEDPELAALEAAWARVADPEVKELELLQALSALMGSAHGMLASALGTLEEEQRDALFTGFPPFCEAWHASHFPGAELTQAQASALEAASNLLVSMPVDRARVAAVSLVLARMAQPEFLQSLPKRLARLRSAGVAPEGFSGDIVASAGEQPAELVVLAGPGRSTLAGAAALVIDLGGNDRWERAAVVDGPLALAAVALDLGGDDAYETQTPGPAYACGGVAVLVDRTGKDTYRSGQLGQAASLLGFALLADLAGDDAYAAEDFGQAYTLGGIALLHEASGDDTYQAWAYAQGAGNGPGFAALVDGAGDDRYLADGHWPDIYGDSGPGVFHGASQGFSSGMRPAIPGGIAALLDLGRGADDYQSGSFSQGGAYFFAFALLYDEGGNDTGRGSRYSQGFGVHQAAALKWDAGGDDRIICRSVANLGMAWDDSVGIFLDDAGDDIYEGGGLSCGGAAQTGIAFFVDAGGDDRYTSAGEADSQGGSGDSEYHGKPSIGFLLDLGGGKDAYSRPGRTDDARQGLAGCGLFWDAKDKTLEKLLRR